VLDTHVWLWWLDAPRRLSRAATRAVRSADRVAVSVMSVLEVADLMERRHIRVDVATRSWIREALVHVECLALTPEIAVDAAQLRFARDPFDRVIYATARAEGAPLITRDERLRSLDPALTVW
jgi:PIN domain nuclease of toxin-antitoxin system